MFEGGPLVWRAVIQMEQKRAPSPNDEDCPPLKVVRISKAATLPARATEGSAGYDLCASEDATIPPGMRKVVRTDLSISVPSRHYGRVAPRSGLAYKHGIDIGAGVIDSDYTGPLGIVMINNGVKDFEIKVGDRVAQLLLERVSVPPVEEVEALAETVRGAKGFGSTGSSALPNEHPAVESSTAEVG